MLVWYQPKPNEVNFLPWIEHHLSRRRSKRLFLYGSVVTIIMLGLVAFGVLYVNLTHAQTDAQWHVSQGMNQLQAKQQGLWADSLEQRHMKLGQVIKAQEQFQAWLPGQELSQLLMMLQPDQLLNSWHWQPIDAVHQVAFAVTGHGQWQAWWQEALIVWPSMQMEALGAEGDGWRIEARYLLSQTSLPLGDAVTMPTSQSFALQLTPAPLSAGVEAEPISSMTQKVAKYGQGLEIVRGQGFNVKMQLDSSQWAGLAPLPSAAGWKLNDLSIQQIPSGHWRVSMQWSPNNDNSPPYLLRPAPSVVAQALTRDRIQHYAQARYAKTLPAQAKAIQAELANISPLHNELQAEDIFQFVGYSQQQGKIAVAWVKSLVNGRLVRVKVGDLLEGWHVSAIGPQGINLTMGQQLLMLERLCLTGVCQK